MNSDVWMMHQNRRLCERSRVPMAAQLQEQQSESCLEGVLCGERRGGSASAPLGSAAIASARVLSRLAAQTWGEEEARELTGLHHDAGLQMFA